MFNLVAVQAYAIAPEEVTPELCRNPLDGPYTENMKFDDVYSEAIACYPASKDAVHNNFNSVFFRVRRCRDITNAAVRNVNQIKNIKPVPQAGIDTTLTASIELGKRQNSVWFIAAGRCNACHTDGPCEPSDIASDAANMQVIANSNLAAGLTAITEAIKGGTNSVCVVHSTQARNIAEGAANGGPDQKAIASIDKMQNQCEKDFNNFNKAINSGIAGNNSNAVQMQNTKDQIQRSGMLGSTLSTLATVGIAGGGMMMVDRAQQQAMVTPTPIAGAPTPTGLNPAATEAENRAKGYIKIDGKYVNCVTDANYGVADCKSVMTNLCQTDDFKSKGGCLAFAGTYCAAAATTAKSNFCLITQANEYCAQKISSIADSPACAWKAQRPSSCLAEPENVQCLLPMTAAALKDKCTKYGFDPICRLSESRVLTQPETSVASIQATGSGVGSLSSVIGLGTIGGASALIRANSEMMDNLQTSDQIR